MGVDIYPLSLGFTECYVIKGEEAIMIDSGIPSKESLLKAIKKTPVAPKDIRLIIITHGHFDHIGSAKVLKELTGAKVAMHRVDKDCLEKSELRMPKAVNAWGNILKVALYSIKFFIKLPATKVDMVIGDDGLPLTDYGVPGRVIYTPGHTLGSLSVLLDSGEAFVGDLAMNKLPLRFGPGLPIFAEDIQKVKESWKYLLEKGARRVYPGHGKPFSAEVLRRALA